MVEAVVAAGILLVAIVLSMTPLIISMRSIDRSKDVTIAEGLAQARIEEVRALPFADVGHPSGAPSGSLQRSYVTTAEGADFQIDTVVEFVGSSSGLNVIPQGGDGVEGAFDVGVDYKYVRVVVTPLQTNTDPVTMETFLAPPTIGGLGDLAVVGVQVVRHEPFDVSVDPGPALRLSGPWIYESFSNDAQQNFADVIPGDYTVSLVTSHGWLIHPDTVASGATSVTAVTGTTTQRTIRVYQPVDLDVTVIDDATGQPIANATVTATDQSYGSSSTNPAGDYSFVDLVPDHYVVGATAPGYDYSWTELDVPGPGATGTAIATVRMVPLAYTPVNYTFFVDFVGNPGDAVAGADIVVTHGTYGPFAAVTDENGVASFALPESTSGFTVMASTSTGHGAAVQSFTTGTTDASVSLRLSQPANTDHFLLSGGGPGPDGFFEFRVAGGAWIRVGANSAGRASFVVDENRRATVELYAFCRTADYPAFPASTTSTTLSNRDQSWNAGASC